MAIEKKEVEYAKELDDVMKLTVELLRDIVAKKGALEIGAENLPLLMAAVDWAMAIKDEFAANKSAAAQTVGMRAGELLALFI